MDLGFGKFDQRGAAMLLARQAHYLSVTINCQFQDQSSIDQSQMYSQLAFLYQLTADVAVNKCSVSPISS